MKPLKKITDFQEAQIINKHLVNSIIGGGNKTTRTSRTYSKLPNSITGLQWEFDIVLDDDVQ